MQNSVAFNYQNQSRASRLNYFPELFYFTNSGWRFSVNANLSYGFRRSRAGFTSLGTPTTVNEETASSTGNVRVGASIRKEFGIPIPFTKKKNYTKTFVAFYDQNGNSIKDKDEPSLENVVIQVGLDELITNKDGIAQLIYASGGTYAYKAFSLENLKGWFPNIDDSLSIVSEGKEFVPFVKGVKLFGKIVVDREKLRVDADKPMDLTNIKITASGNENAYALTDFEGNFEFYLPNGSYTVSIDEAILGSKYKLAKNNILVYLTQGVEGVFITFYIVERKRKITRKKFGNGGVQTFGETTESDSAKSNIKLQDIIPEGQQNYGKQNASNDGLDNGAGMKGGESQENESASNTNKNQNEDSANGNKNETPLNPEDIPERNITPPDFKTPIEDIIDMDNIDPNKVGYYIDLGSFEGSIPTNVLNGLLKMGFRGGEEKDGKIHFKSDVFKTQAEAEVFKVDSEKSGFNDPEPLMLGDYDGNKISVEKANELYQRGVEQQGGN